MSQIKSIVRLCTTPEFKTFNEIFPEKNLEFIEKRRSWFFYKDPEEVKYVYKVIYLGLHYNNSEEALEKGSLEDVLRELNVLKCLSLLKSGSSNFCFPDKTWLVHDAQGPKVVLEEGLISPTLRAEACVTEKHLYAVFRIPTDEAFTLGAALHDPSKLSYCQVLSVFCQLSLSLACAERQLEFEHRDLHVNNILLSPTQHTYAVYHLDPTTTVKVPTFGILPRIAEVGQARLRSGNTVFFKSCAGPFQKGHPLYIIRPGQLQQFHPRTNLRYLQRHYKSLLVAYGNGYQGLVLPLLSRFDDVFTFYKSFESTIEMERSKCKKDSFMKRLAGFVRKACSKKTAVGSRNPRDIIV